MLLLLHHSCNSCTQGLTIWRDPSSSCR
jgi:hypothetical protein